MPAPTLFIGGREMREMSEEEREEFEVLAEWTIRRLRPLETVSEEGYTERAKRWVLYSLGLEELHQDIFLYLEKRLRTTTTEIAKEFNISPTTARKYLDELHTVGLVDYIGREYTLTYESLSRAIELMLIPRITDTLRTIARGASSTEFPVPPLRRLSVGGVETIRFSGDLGKKLLEAWLRRGKRVHIRSVGSLRIEKDVDPTLFDSVVERVDVSGSLRIPADVYAATGHKFNVTGSVKVH